MNKKLIAMICSLIFVLAGGMLLFGVTLSVNEYRLSGTIYSEQARAEASEAHQKLDEKLGTNLLFVSEKEIRSVFDEYPYLSVLSVEKDFPKRVEIRIEEKMEVYAIPYRTAESRGYCMVDRNGLILNLKGDNANRLDGEANVPIEGIEIQNPVVGQTVEESSYTVDGRTQEGAFGRLQEALAILHDRFGGLRSCVRSVSFRSPTGEEKDETFVCAMSEGVTITLVGPGVKGTEKAEAAAARYLSLNDTQKLFGKIFVCDDAEKENGILCSYTAREDSDL
ncbi:MAG: FtsQ-type POTRA domain-containing protein [Clostridia bacterium]|nr:FtsQ-type POTRA domain-containing protein [Clostridia bacterium]